MKKLLLFISLVSVINAEKGNYSISYGLSTNHVKYGKFKDEYEFYTQSLNYSQIIFCNQDASKSFQDAMKIIKNHTKFTKNPI